MGRETFLSFFCPAGIFYFFLPLDAATDYVNVGHRTKKQLFLLLLVVVVGCCWLLLLLVVVVGCAGGVIFMTDHRSLSGTAQGEGLGRL